MQHLWNAPSGVFQEREENMILVVYSGEWCYFWAGMYCKPWKPLWIILVTVCELLSHSEGQWALMFFHVLYNASNAYQQISNLMILRTILDLLVFFFYPSSVFQSFNSTHCSVFLSTPSAGSDNACQGQSFNQALQTSENCKISTAIRHIKAEQWSASPFLPLCPSSTSSLYRRARTEPAAKCVMCSNSDSLTSTNNQRQRTCSTIVRWVVCGAWCVCVC